MKKQAGLVLLEYIPKPSGESVYKVSQTRNTVEWSIGQILSKVEVLSILKRTGLREVEIIIKGIEFEE